MVTLDEPWAGNVDRKKGVSVKQFHLAMLDRHRIITEFNIEHSRIY
jgi:hypothetical protein